MTKLKPLILALALSLWSQSSSAELIIQIEKHLSVDSSGVYALAQKTAEDFWFSEEQFWKVVPKTYEIKLDFAMASAEHWAQTHSNQISINVYAPREDFDAIVKHEVSHVFLNAYCPKVADPFVHELFSYWRSGDYLRLLYGQSQMYSKAQAVVKLQSKSKFDASKAIAAARIISELVTQDKKEILDVWFRNLIHHCNGEGFLKEQSTLKDRFLAILSSESSINPATSDSGFLVFDSVANEVLEAEGSWDKAQPVGSTLKPFMVSFFSDIKNDKFKKDGPEWECGENGKSWNYKKALNYSCNGFFLDTKIKKNEIETYTNILNSISNRNYSPRWLNVADLIGLWPTIKLTLLDLARLYDYVIERDPGTMAILKKTADQGTLAAAPESKWFVKNHVALKSGTTTKLDLSVESGFVVAVIDSDHSPKIAVLFKSGTRPVDLLLELKTKIGKYIGYSEPRAQVQVMSAFNPASIQISCPTLLLKSGSVTSENFVPNQLTSSSALKFSCVGAPFEVAAPDGDHRRLYGDLTFKKIESKSLTLGGRSEKNLRAQIGSQIVLHTSESHYLKSVFFSESLNHRSELKKALLLVIKNNLGYWNRKNAPVCDSTLCQVFNLNYEQVRAPQKKAVQDLILELGPLRLDSKNWLEFSLGGKDVWQRSIPLDTIADYLEMESSQVISGFQEGSDFKFKLKDDAIKIVSCENLRGHFKLRSCPSSFEKLELSSYVFQGYGDGHGRGMDLDQANQMAIQGFNYDEILEKFYGLKVLSN